MQLKIQVILDGTPCRLVESYLLLCLYILTVCQSTRLNIQEVLNFSSHILKALYVSALFRWRSSSSITFRAVGSHLCAFSLYAFCYTELLGLENILR
jgi:hypothetical protein